MRPVLLALLFSTSTLTAGDWPWWRGPHRNGVAEAGQTPLTHWSDQENIVWKADVPGRGHGSPIVVGDRVFLATADVEAETQMLLCFDRGKGTKLWQTPIHQGGLVKGGNGKSTHASSTPACDGKRVYINFLNGNAVHATAVSVDGKVLWQTKVTDYVLHQGFGSSPTVYDSLLLVTADNKGSGAIAALGCEKGEIVWKVDRPRTPNYASPIVLPIAGRDQLVLTGCNLVASFDPKTGVKNWEMEGSTTECVTSTVVHKDIVFTSGGFPKSHVAAVKADGSKQTVWTSGTRVYVPSMIAHEGHLYAVADNGFAMCWNCETGDEKWKQRIEGTYSASLVLVNDLLYAVSEAGQTTIFKTSPDGYTEVARNQLGNETFSTPAICDGRIYLRVASKQAGKRQETLYCIGK